MGGNILFYILNLTGFTIRKYLFRQKIKKENWFVYNPENLLIGIIFILITLLISYTYWEINKE